MPLLPSSDWQRAEAIAAIGYTNPFLPERLELERKALGPAFIGSQPFLQYRADRSIGEMFPNARALRDCSEPLLEQMRDKLLAGEPANDFELEVYENLTLYVLYARYMSAFMDLPFGKFLQRPEADILQHYGAFTRDYRRFLELPDRQLPSRLDPDVIFAGLFQVERAFFHIFRHIVGASLPAARLRAAIWQSVFTHDMRRYLRTLYRHMGDLPTLITGPSGTGKELVALAIASSRYVEFDGRRRRFLGNYAESFVALNLAACSPNLIESELFGHAKGAFTDAKTERPGFLDESRCPPWGSLFLDEIGELDAYLQVKLLRVLQSREYQRVGESTTRPFVGKIIAATNRNLAQEIQAGRFRDDFYFRLCADRIETPSLRSQLEETPEDIVNFVRFIAQRLLPETPDEAKRLTDEVTDWIQSHLGPDYLWPGNIRELEQCTRSVMIRGSYEPLATATAEPGKNPSRLAQFLQRIERGELTRDELLTGYASLLYAQLGNYRAAGRALHVDWRTVKELVDPQMARQFQDPHA